MYNILYWAVLIVFSIFVYWKLMNKWWDDTCGVKKIKGEYVRVAYPDHYTFSGLGVAYVYFIVVIIVVVYIASAELISALGWVEKYKIMTGLAIWKELFRL